MDVTVVLYSFRGFFSFFNLNTGFIRKIRIIQPGLILFPELGFDHFYDAVLFKNVIQQTLRSGIRSTCFTSLPRSRETFMTHSILRIIQLLMMVNSADEHKSPLL